MKSVIVPVILLTKLKTIFPTGQLKFPGYISPFPRNKNHYGGYLMIFVTEHTTSNMLLRKHHL